MADERDTDFKVTDRRKFNTDGSVREGYDESASTPTGPPEAARLPEEQPPGERAAAAAAHNVLSFPSEDARSEEPEPKPEPRPARGSAQSQKSSAAEDAYQDTNSGKSSRLPEASLLSLVNILAVEAAMHLGLVEGPEGPTEVDLEAARHMIDLLGLLQQRTRGNLTPEEDHMLDNVLADLRIKFVALSKGR